MYLGDGVAVLPMLERCHVSTLVHPGLWRRRGGACVKHPSFINVSSCLSRACLGESSRVLINKLNASGKGLQLSQCLLSSPLLTSGIHALVVVCGVDDLHLLQARVLTQHNLIRKALACKKASFFERFPYVCPEPVLANVRSSV